jgi:purine-binding chemotaxis protein CheW
MSVIEETAPNPIVVFTLDEPRYALPLSVVDCVVRAMEITPLPKAPEIVLGAINAQGRVIPVVDVRKRFRLAPREMNMDDRFIITRTSLRVVALVVDAVEGVRELAGREIVRANEALPFAEYLHGVAKTEQGLVLIYDLDRFLSLDEGHRLDVVLSGGSE